MKLNLPASITSMQDLSSLIMEIRTYAKWCSSATIKKKVQAGQPVDPPAVTPAALELLEAWSDKNGITQKQLDALLDALAECKATAPNITITLAAPAGNVLRRELVAWCRQNLAPDALVSFAFNATLLGGMVVRCGSHIYDWSFRQKIMDNRGAFPEILRHV